VADQLDGRVRPVLALHLCRGRVERLKIEGQRHLG